jgi:hypothetical protein
VVLHGRGMCGGQGERVLVRGVLVNSRLQIAVLLSLLPWCESSIL